MDLIVNEPAAALGSRGIRRYFAGVMRHLAWPDEIERLPVGRWRAAERVKEFMRLGRQDAIFWTPCQRGPLFAKHHVVTVHDCISVEYVYPGDWRLGPYLRLFNQVLQNADAIVSISQATKSALLRHYRIDPASIHVIRSGTDALDAPSTSTLGASDRGRPFVLMVTNDLPHKNTKLACEALACSRLAARGIGLQVVGSLTAAATLACRSAGIALEIEPFVSDERLRELYATCLFLFSPSLAEGHNLPVAEAVSYGSNVLCSDIDVHREYYEGRVAFFDPKTRDSIVHAIDSSIDRTGRWFAPSGSAPTRGFADVAREYETLFRSIQVCR